MSPRTTSLLMLAALTSACGGAATSLPHAAPGEPRTKAEAVHATVTPAPAQPPPALSPPVDEQAVAAATGVAKADRSPDGVVKASWPRADVPVAVDGWKMPPFLGLTSWVAFAPGRKDVAEAMIMGDLVLFEDEVSTVMSALLDRGLQVTALHNHFFFDAPRVYFLHVGGEGKVSQLGAAVKAALDETATIRKQAPKPAASFGGATLPERSSLDVAALDAALGTRGQPKDGMYKAVWGREVIASCGCPTGKAMGVNTWAAFAGAPDNAVVDGDFAVAEAELQPVLKELRRGGVHVVAIHHHMSGEQPRILFLHYWGRGRAADLAAVVKRALDLTAWLGKDKAG